MFISKHEWVRVKCDDVYHLGIVEEVNDNDAIISIIGTKNEFHYNEKLKVWECGTMVVEPHRNVDELYKVFRNGDILSNKELDTV